jgi:SAM-dependent methyltransferase
MKILSFDPPQERVNSIGMQRVHFRGLDDLVVLTGPNGAGKTRIFQLLQQMVHEPSKRIATRDQAMHRIESCRRSIRERENRSNGESQQLLATLRLEIKKAERALDSLRYISLDEEVERITVVNFVPTRTDMQDPQGLSPDDLKNRARVASNVGVDQLWLNALAYIQNKQNRYREVTHQHYEGAADEKEQTIREYETLCALIEALLHSKVGRSADSDATIFERPLGKSQLSEGQKVLLQFVVAVHPSHDDKGLILMMDEPENHLHPAALISVFDRIRLAFPHPQIWVATHSVPLLAHLFDRAPSSLHFIKDGCVTFAGNKPEEVLEGLVGTEHERFKLLRFIDLPYTLAALRFAADCLTEPHVAEHRHSDPQLMQVGKILTRKRDTRVSLKILDFGAGKGRLLAGLADIGGNVAEKFDYIAYDSSAKEKAVCTQEITNAYQSAEGRWFSTSDDLFSNHAPGTFDVVVMCNVLHEISPDLWPGVFKVVSGALSDKGSLLVVEDYRVPVGELPNVDGFFLLDRIHLQRLFGLSEQSELREIVTVETCEGRLRAHAISKDATTRVSSTSKKDAIESLRDTCVSKLKELRQNPDLSFKGGHMHALWAQQFANCCLYLEKI